MSTVKERLLEMICERRGAPVVATDRLADLGVDSIEMAGFVRELEDGFGVEVDEEVFDLQTVGELIRYVEQRSRGA